ncbi:uncharacterized protein LOC123319517 [Coccinella septempunctata]|uniref:uncharacterized protein LOC123319517 n=1 Tax=Coccinella septempunctata TaxID=41139 RepID=UPI001D07F639|nr:uncharacterized protein LOC123319517 [Coccinella septempunctata]
MHLNTPNHTEPSEKPKVAQSSAIPQRQDEPKKSNRPSTEPQCWRCGGKGHLRAQCTSKPLLFCSRCGDKEFPALLDTGATRSFISSEVAAYCRVVGIQPDYVRDVTTTVANGSSIPIKEIYTAPVRIGSEIMEAKLLLVSDLPINVVLGMDILRTHNFSINLQTAECFLNGRSIQARLSEPENRGQLHAIGPLLSNLSGEEKVRLEEFLQTELKAFEKLRGTTPLIQHRIKLKPGTEPIKQRYRPQNPKMQEIINNEVDRMLAEGIIEPSSSPWSSPIVIVKKKDGILDKLRKAKYISTIDLKQGYWQVPLAPESRPITAFTVPGRGLFQFKVMAFGLHSAPASFQRLLDRVIGPEMEPDAFAYLDDIVVLGETLDEHLDNLRKVFHRLREANLQLNPEKCEFVRKSLKYLGNVVTEDGICTDPDKISAINEMPAPKSVRELRSFLGVASWYRRFIEDFSKVVTPLTALLKKKQTWKWGTAQQTAFETLKQKLTHSPVLACPDFSKPFVLQTDASDAGLGAALTQTVDGQEKVIAYASRTLSGPEKNYSVTEKECLAIVWSIDKLRPYLEGYRFTVITDHMSLRWLQSIKSPTGRIARWSIFLQQYDFEIKNQYGYRRGSSTCDAVMRFVEYTLDCFERGSLSLSIFLDLSRAFDCVPPQALVDKLSKYGFDEVGLGLIRSYFFNRTQRVFCNNTWSTEGQLSLGVPQGSILGPLLFIIFMNDFSFFMAAYEHLLWADDSGITVEHKEMRGAEQLACAAELRAKEWFALNKLVCNEEKTDTMLFNLRGLKDHNANESIKFLGVHLDSGLTWIPHGNETASKVTKNIFLLRNLANIVSKKVVKVAYHSLIESHLRYCVLIWGNCSSREKIFRLQRRAVRIVAGLGYRDDCLSAFKELKILTFPSIYIHECLVYAYNNIRDLPKYGDTHDYHTRYRNDIKSKYMRLEKSKNGPNFISHKLFSKLPVEVKRLTPKEFNKRINEILTTNAFWSVQEFLSSDLTSFEINY